MSFPNGELCVKRTRVGGKGRVSHMEEAYNGVHAGCVRDCVWMCACVCVADASKRKGDAVHAGESIHLSTPRCSERVGLEIKGKIK